MDKTQIEQDIAQVVTGATSSDKRPLEGHTSEATAYQVDDYPYGVRVRTQIRYWLEHSPKKGWRFVSQTKNPKTGAWNKPKTSTYTDWGATMYLDADDHVQWVGIGPYSNDRDILAFVQAFPRAQTTLGKVAPQKLRYLQGRLDGQIIFEINGQPIPLSQSDRDRLHDEIAIWQQISRLVA